MPIYEYACESCRSRFEVQQKVSDPPISTCVKCGAPVTKVISAPAIMFKGSGWYVTDYSEKLKPPSGSDTDGKPAGESQPASESKTEPKADSKTAGTTTANGAASSPTGTPPASSPSSTPSGGSGSS